MSTLADYFRAQRTLDDGRIADTIVINCSYPHYNLGAHKLYDWLTSCGHVVRFANGDPGEMYGYDLVCLSCVFSWNAPAALDIALKVKGHSEVWAGGPGLYALARWWRNETGLELHKGTDMRFDRQRGNYKMTFASRGCNVGCSFCIVPKMEGREFTLDWDFVPAPILCDNNLSGLPVEFQIHIVRRYLETKTELKDANSGFEPKMFDAGTYQRWKPVIKGAWRFAFDETKEAEEVRLMMDILKNEPASKKRVYVLCGNEPVESCYERAQKVIEWGGEPYCQFVLPLNWLGDTAKLRPRFDWTYQKGRDFCRYYNRWVWRSCPISKYNNRKYDAPPFANLANL